MSEKQYDFPTEVIDLPSEGKVYPLDNPLSSGKVTLKYMTAKEEDILSSQNLIKKGVVLDKLFESIIVDDVNIDDITIGDKNAIILATRVLGYGAEYKVEITDPSTLEEQSVTIDLSKVKTKDFNEELLNSENLYKFKLPKSGAELEFKLLTHGDELEITKENQALARLYKGKGDSTFDVTTRLKYMIQSVDGNKDRGYITKWVQNSFLALDTKAFRKYVKEISPDMDLKFNFTSELTGEEEALDIPFGAGFFYPAE